MFFLLRILIGLFFTRSRSTFLDSVNVFPYITVNVTINVFPYITVNVFVSIRLKDMLFKVVRGCNKNWRHEEQNYFGRRIPTPSMEG